jgi:hypothetical protein
MGSLHMKKQMSCMLTSTDSDLASFYWACLIGLELKYHWPIAFVKPNSITDCMFMLIAKPLTVVEV